MHPSVGTVAVVLSWLLLVSALNAAEIHASSRVILGTPYPDICYLYIVGDMEAGDGEKFRLTALEAIRDGCTKIDRVTIYSPRGNLMEAMAIGEQVSVLGASTYTPSVSTFVVDANPKAKSLFKDVSFTEGKRTCVLEPDDWEAQILMGKKPTPRKKLEYHPVTGEGDPRCTCASACFFIWAAGARRIGGFIQIHRPYLTPDKYARLSLAEAKAVYEEMAVIVRAYYSAWTCPRPRYGACSQSAPRRHLS